VIVNSPRHIREQAILSRMHREQDVINRWTGSAPYWEKHREVIRQMFAPVTQALVEDAGIASGHQVLDVAAGPGEPALSVAALVGDHGKVVGIDPIPEMVAAARRAADRLALKNVNFEVAFAGHLPFPDNTFDAVISRFGVMFFPAPLDALREILRVLKPHRKLALAAWHLAERNPFHTSLSRVIDLYVEPTPLEPDALDTFRFAESGKLLELLRAAGAENPTESLLQFTIDAPVSMEDFWTLRLEISDKLRGKIGALSKDLVAEVKHRTFESLREYSIDGGMSFPAEVLIVSATKARTT
jgi:ubiquinone/menaquinone biosynthesis C-methylase UbiE